MAVQRLTFKQVPKQGDKIKSPELGEATFQNVVTDQYGGHGFPVISVILSGETKPQEYSAEFFFRLDDFRKEL